MELIISKHEKENAERSGFGASSFKYGMTWPRHVLYIKSFLREEGRESKFVVRMEGLCCSLTNLLISHVLTESSTTGRVVYKIVMEIPFLHCIIHISGYEYMTCIVCGYEICRVGKKCFFLKV